jgi:tRNA nucleotidyltransferase/poly(A) polymerase
MSIDLTTQLKNVSAVGIKHAVNLYMVGGTLRDFLLGRDCSDYDFTAIGAKEIAMEFSTTQKLPLVKLDNTPGRETFRVVLQDNFYFDFTEMQGATINEDLSQRDFTINSIAIHLDDFLLNKKTYIDPFNGQEDLLKKSVRKIPGPVFISDPLRLIRAFRFACTLGFAIDSDTLDQISKHREKISHVSVERIYYEWILTLESFDASGILQTMDKVGLLQSVFPEIKQIKDSPQWKHCFSSCNTLDSYFKGSLKAIPLQIDPRVSEPTTRKCALLKFAALLVPWTTLSDSINARVMALMQRLHASNSDQRFLLQCLQIFKDIMRSELDFVNQLPESPAKIYQFVKQSAEELVPTFVLAWSHIASSQSARDQETYLLRMQSVLKFYYKIYLPAQKTPALMDGTILQKKFKLSPSPLFRTILAKVEEGRVLGTIKNHNEAAVAVQKIIDAQPTSVEGKGS